MRIIRTGQHLLKSIDTKKATALFLVSYSVIYLLIRLTNLLVLPAHYDELLQIQRVEAMIGEGNIFIGMREIMKWFQLVLITMLFWLPAKSLWIGRFVATLSGLAGGIGIYVLATELFRRPYVAFLAAFLYLITPFVFFYDRLVTPDSLLTSLGVWTMVFSVRLVRRGQLRWAIFSGLTIVAAALSKPTGLAYLVIPLTALIFLKPSEISAQILKLMTIIYGIGAVLFVSLAFVLISSPLARSRYAGKIIIGGSQDYWKLWVDNSLFTVDWVVSLMTIPLFVMAVAGVLLVLFRKDRRGMFLLAIPTIFPLAFILFSKRWYPRYLLPIIPSLLVLGAWSLVNFYEYLGRYRKFFRPHIPILIGTGVILIIPALTLDFWLLVEPTRATLPDRERWQYFEDWPSAYGLAEAAGYIEKIASEYDYLFLAVNKNSLIVNGALEYYFDQPDNVEIVTFDAYAGSMQTIDRLNKWALERPTFLILNASDERGMGEILNNSGLFFQGVKRAVFPKPGNKISIDVYQWLSVPDTVAQWAARNGIESGIVLSPQYVTYAVVSEVEQADANFVLVDMSTGLFNSPAQLSNFEEWIPLIPPDWALTRHYPGLWYLFRLENNAPPQYPAGSVFGQTIALTGFDLPRQKYSPGETLPLTLHWQAISDVPENYIIQVQLFDVGHTSTELQEFQPSLPSRQWFVGQRLADGYDLSLADDISPGTYRIGVGVSDPVTGEQLSISSENGQNWPDNVLILKDIVIVKP